MSVNIPVPWMVIIGAMWVYQMVTLEGNFYTKKGGWNPWLYLISLRVSNLMVIRFKRNSLICAQPAPCCSFALHLVRKIVIPTAHFLITISTAQLDIYLLDVIETNYTPWSCPSPTESNFNMEIHLPSSQNLSAGRHFQITISAASQRSFSGTYTVEILPA